MSNNSMKLEKELWIRNALQNDLEDVCDIDQEAFSPYGTAELPDIFQARLKTFPQGFIVAQREDKLVGYGTSEKWAVLREPTMNEDPYTTHVPTGLFFCITAMAVRKDWQNHGVGSALLEALRKIAIKENCIKIILETTHAQDFYFQRGFYILGERGQMNAQLQILASDL